MNGVRLCFRFHPTLTPNGAYTFAIAKHKLLIYVLTYTYLYELNKAILVLKQ